MGLRAETLGELERLLPSRYRHVNGVVVVRRGYIVFEWYRLGYGTRDTHNVASVTKSVMSALVGIAIEAGYVQSVDQKILEFFPEYVPGAGDTQKRTLTLKHLLSMTAPIAWKTGAWGYEPLNRLRRQRDWVTFILDLLGREGQLGRFQYSSVCPHLISAILSRTTGQCARAFANERLFRPLGMAEIPDRDMTSFQRDDVFGKNVTGWIKDPGGITTGGWGLTITPRDMARFGFLYLNHGTWDNTPLIPGGMDRRVNHAERQRIRVLLVAPRGREHLFVFRRRIRRQSHLLRARQRPGRRDRLESCHEVTRPMATRPRSTFASSAESVGRYPAT